MNIASSKQKNSRFISTVTGLLLLGLSVSSASAATKTWDGGGVDSRWQSPGNWDLDTPPAANDLLVFTGTARLTTTNNFAGGTAFNGITIASPAGAFVHNGAQITLGGNIANNQVVTLQTINLAMALSASRSVNVVTDGSLRFGGVVSGTGFGLTKTGGGLLTLAAANTFSGPVSVNDGLVAISSDGNLGTAPGVATPASLVLDGGGLRSTSSLTLNPNRGIAVGPTVGTGSGRIEVNSGTLTYGGVIANNGGTGGLSKAGPGTLNLFGANTYTGPTSNRVGVLFLDFGNAAAPNNNIIAGVSPLALGGENTGIATSSGTANPISLVMNSKTSGSNTQLFSSTFIDIGASLIRVTNSAGGSAVMNLGPITVSSGGVVAFVTPTAAGGSGAIKTTSTNNNGILGGFATFSGGGNVVNSITQSTNWASVDGSGNIVPFTDFRVMGTGENLFGNVSATNNVLIDNTSTGDIRVDVDEAGTVTDINTLLLNRTGTGFAFQIGTNNTLRLGKFGGIFESVATSSLTYEFGNGVGTANGPQNVGRLTAGGPTDNTPGMIVFTKNSSSQTAGSLNTEVEVADNGTGAVTVVKTGPGPMKFRGHNTYSGGTYILQGRFQMAGTELGGLGGTANPDGFGTGPVYILPGAQAFPSGAGTDGITNDWFIAGNGVSDQVGAIRLSGVMSNTITLIGDARLGGGGFASGVAIYGKITGPFSLDFGATGNSGGGANGARLFSSENDWTGNTTIVGRTGTAGNTILRNANDEVIPDGFGKGNVQLGNSGNTVSVTGWELGGFNETINGLVSIGTVPSLMWITNGGVTASSLTLGNNDASGSFSGSINGNLSLTKIGGGTQTLTGNNTYSGDTTINGGTLALSGSGVLSSTPNVRVNTGGALNVEEVTGGYTTANAVRLDGGTLIGNTAATGIGTLTMTNGALTVTVDTAVTNVFANTLSTGGDSNVVNISAVLGISAYPSEFTVIKYSGALNGVMNFVIGTRPGNSTTGFFSNDVVNSRIVLVLTDGPKPLTWAGNVNGNWDINSTQNWLAFGSTPAPFNSADSVLFPNNATTGNVDVTTDVVPSEISVNNSSLDYVFTGVGGIGGFGGLTKSGSGTVTFLNTGGDSYRGGVAVNEGTVVFGSDNGITGNNSIASGAVITVGLNGPTGNLPGGPMVNDGTINFNRTTDQTVSGAISGLGNLVKSNANILTLSGENSFTGSVSVVSGTLRAGNGSALGAINGDTTIANGATLDVNSQNLGAEPVIITGSGVGGNGVVVNNGTAGQNNALRVVTLAGDVVFGGTSRWDIRGSGATAGDGVLNGGGFNITKIGQNQVSLVHAALGDGSLNDIIVKEGMFSIETSTGPSALGFSGSIVVSNGASLQLFGTTAVLQKDLVLHGSGTNTTLNIDNTGVNELNGNIALTGNVILNNAGTSSANINSSWNGTANLLIQGTGTNHFGGSISYVGSTVITNASVFYNNFKSSGTGMTTHNARLGGAGTVSESVNMNGGSIAPGSLIAPAATFTINGNLQISNTASVFDLDTTGAGFGNDRVVVNGTLSIAGTNNIVVVPTSFLGEFEVYTLFSHTGGAFPSAITNNLNLIPVPGYQLSIQDPATTGGDIRVRVDRAIKNLVWWGVSSTIWDVNGVVNWVHNNAGFANSVFTNLDIVNFETLNQSATNVTLVGNLEPTQVNFANGFAMYLVGSGSIVGEGGMRLNGSIGGVHLNNTGTNTFTGPVQMDGGTLHVGSGGLGSGAVLMTNNLASPAPILHFYPTGTLNISNAMSGNLGTIVQNSTGKTYLYGASTGFGGPINIEQGTLAAGIGSALGSTNGITTVSDGATLDVNGQNLGSEQVRVGGAGVGGNGAIVNNASNAATSALRFVTLTGDTVLGGSTRWDIRGQPAALLTDGFPYSITKKGTNQISMVAITNVDPAFLNIDIQEGTFAIQTSTTQVGDPSGTITIHPGAALNFFNLATPLNKNITLQSGGTITNESGTSTIIGPLSVTGNANISASGVALVLSNTITGTTTTFTKRGVGSLQFVGNSLPAFTTLEMLGGTLDLTAATVQNIALGSGQTLHGNGLILGNVNGSGAAVITVAPTGTNLIGRLSVSNSITLPSLGQTLLDIAASRAANTNSDTIAASSVAVGGTLIVSNVDGALTSGMSFQLFDTPSYTGSFTSIQLPALTGELEWENTLSTDGRITVIGDDAPAIQTPRIVSAVRSGSNLIMSGTNGTTNGTFYVITSTNIALPLTNWSIVSTSTFGADGSFSVTNAIDTTKPRQFFDLLQQVP